MASFLPIYYSHHFLNHDTGVGHPEQPDRLKACVSALKNCYFSDQLVWKSPRVATEEELSVFLEKRLFTCEFTKYRVVAGMIMKTSNMVVSLIYTPICCNLKAVQLCQPEYLPNS